MLRYVEQEVAELKEHFKASEARLQREKLECLGSIQQVLTLLAFSVFYWYKVQILTPAELHSSPPSVPESSWRKNS
jgi:hypothetical protein